MVNGIPVWFLAGLIYVWLLAAVTLLAVVWLGKENEMLSERVAQVTATLRAWKQTQWNDVQDGRIADLETQDAAFETRLQGLETRAGEVESNFGVLLDGIEEVFAVDKVDDAAARAAKAGKKNPTIAIPNATGTGRRRGIHGR